LLQLSGIGPKKILEKMYAREIHVVENTLMEIPKTNRNTEPPIQDTAANRCRCIAQPILTIQL
jgi:hypothetical protein